MKAAGGGNDVPLCLPRSSRAVRGGTRKCVLEWSSDRGRVGVKVGRDLFTRQNAGGLPYNTPTHLRSPVQHITYTQPHCLIAFSQKHYFSRQRDLRRFRLHFTTQASKISILHNILFDNHHLRHGPTRRHIHHDHDYDYDHDYTHTTNT